MEKKIETTPTGVIVEKTEHEDGRVGVTVHLNSLNLENPTEEDIIAKDFIEQNILPELAKRIVLLTVIHTETLMKASVKVRLPEVRMVAEKLIAGFPVHEAGVETFLEDFIIVEVEGDDVRVTALE